MATRRNVVQAVPATEVDIRVRILNSFMSCPHRDTDQIKRIHEEIREQDPLFYSHLACWYLKKGEVRDHNEVFAAMLITDSYIDNREVGLALFRRHAIFMKDRILGFIRGKKVKIRVKTGKNLMKKGKSISEVRMEEKFVGMKNSTPSSFETEVKNYLRWLESDNSRFDSTALKNRADLKNLYVKLKVSPSDRAQAILFEKKIPKDSKLSVLEEISKASPVKSAKLIVENKIPYTVAIGLVEKITPSVLVALINSMSPMEVINNMASLEEKGAMKNVKTKALIQEKLKKAEKTKNVSTLKSKVAAKTGRIKDEAVLKQLDKVADIQVKKSGVISDPIAVFVDRSSSMREAIEVGKSTAALISGATVAELSVVAFDTTPMEVVSEGPSLSDWEKAFRPVRPGGCTSMGCALSYLLMKKRVVETIVVITDEGENSSPMFTSVYHRYEKEMGKSPNVVIIHVGSQGTTFSSNLKSANIDFDMYTPAGGDYYALPGLIPLLAKTSKLDLVMEIMETPLLSRGVFR